jgi:hypothetical protein
MTNMTRSTTAVILLLVMFFVATISLVSAAKKVGIRHRLRRKPAAVAGTVNEKYMDLATLVTNDHALLLVQERQQSLRERKMIAFDDFEVISDDARLYDLYGMSVTSGAPSAAPATGSMSLSMSMPVSTEQPALENPTSNLD